MRPRIARALASLTGPVTEQAQQSFLRDLKVSFRQRIQHEAAPVAHVVDRHLQGILNPRSNRLPRPSVLPTHADPAAAARQHFIDGTMTPATVRALLSDAKTHHHLTQIEHWAAKAGPLTTIAQHVELAGKMATKLIHLGLAKDASPLIAQHSKAFIADSAHHPLIILWTAEQCSLKDAFHWRAKLQTHERHQRAVLRILLRAAIRHNDLSSALHCLSLDERCCAGQETGLARWLCEKQRPVQAFSVLRQAEPQRAREAAVGVAIAKQLLRGSSQELVLCRQVLTWTEGLYVLSVQQELKLIEAELDSRLPRVRRADAPLVGSAHSTSAA